MWNYQVWGYFDLNYFVPTMWCTLMWCVSQVFYGYWIHTFVFLPCHVLQGTVHKKEEADNLQPQRCKWSSLPFDMDSMQWENKGKPLSELQCLLLSEEVGMLHCWGLWSRIWIFSWWQIIMSTGWLSVKLLYLLVLAYQFKNPIRLELFTISVYFSCISSWNLFILHKFH